MASLRVIIGWIAVCLAVGFCECNADSHNYLRPGYYKTINANASCANSNPTGTSIFLDGLRELRRVGNLCLGKGLLVVNGGGFRSVASCLKLLTFRRLDEFLSRDAISVAQNIDFVKNGKEQQRSFTKDILVKDWPDLIVERAEKFLRDHSLRIRLADDPIEGRGRRRHHMFAMLMMGFMIMASILVPMGFQFLTVLGGKSLLMAKMALIMSAINGLKKIATSNIGYGLYHYSPEPHHDHLHHGFHEKIFQMKHQPPNQNLPYNVVI